MIRIIGRLYRNCRDYFSMSKLECKFLDRLSKIKFYGTMSRCVMRWMESCHVGNKTTLQLYYWNMKYNKIKLMALILL